ncbi:hypothetical protein BJV85_000496 [Clostridium acetobutylicum]|uniref:Acyl-CoA thioesterase 1 n=1 Tax=Clostridium acetobutylicum (strain ATCC 824 / DSM 792 / JCM 1419 / IAM 19013 / LMG 5710 / NBRC 13948 / NRRL B-527 / VKM B-1787 / 2291 / W) TaxID=272562 RepID=Q97DR5_CLOAB|nr:MULTISPECIES: acyl-CoA thioesterase/bile acid-CoA:amino acid N-acyltransferase family protein [Clostridium]AAK81337.1 Acyl-CoA thioesterase 1 [Clostridium acetobutylicum ATCC 824]ADZ22447.1 Acyl-CoA thioesterase 1 [Clostridium acetobutylicum EA 2018]AEI32827.1 Acyl-CoA thioesterase 1 [Clostridium acetobutylicum DSM 1731]AWV80996.1 acyl-CoA thioesterase [Clostridium acetobutylicum]MBC2395509.1 acyl-CoA thioesterase [Clostridium acetobutylicum]
MKNVKIIIEPQCSMIDEKTNILVQGLVPYEIITIKALSLDYYRIGAKNNNPDNWKWVKKTNFESFAVFKADDKGTVDLSKDAPIKGSYTRVDSMGLFWSMVSTQQQDYTLKKSLSSCPFLTSMEVILKVEVCGKELVSSKCKKLFVSSDVKCQYVTENNLVGKYFTNKNSKIKKGIIVLSGSEGGIHNASQIAALLASHGYPSLALAYFGMDTLPATLNEIPLEYFEKAIDWIITKGDISPNNLTVFGRSRGGELALLLGSTFKKITSVIAVAASPILFGTNTTKLSSWKYKGEDIPYLNLKINIISFLKNALTDKLHGRTINFSKLYTNAIKNPDAIETYMIPIENTNGSILMLSGDNDHIWPSSKLCKLGIERLKQHNFSFYYDFLEYKAGHHIYFPYQPIYKYNGSNENMAISNRESWNKILEFLQKL